jgi:membrane protein HdeD
VQSDINGTTVNVVTINLEEYKMKNWIIMLAVGILSLIAGIMALSNPFAASIAVERLAGWWFLILGVIQVIEAARSETWGGKFWSLLLGIITAFAGISLLWNPIGGLLALTVVLGIVFMGSGAVKVIVGLRVHDAALKWAVVISGAISLILGFMILSNMPGSAVVALGTLLGVELISNGISAIALSLSRKSGGVSHTS